VQDADPYAVENLSKKPPPDGRTAASLERSGGNDANMTGQPGEL
jgi:hypothetical protein